jgi:hypothetical protein
MIETCLLGKNPFTMIALAYRKNSDQTNRVNFLLYTLKLKSILETFQRLHYGRS